MSEKGTICGMPASCVWSFIGTASMLGLRNVWNAISSPDEDTEYAIKMTKRLEKKQFEDQLSYMSGVTRRCWDACIDGAAEAGEGGATVPANLKVDIAKSELVCLEKCMKKVKEFQDLSAMVLATENEKVAERNRAQARAGQQ